MGSFLSKSAPKAKSEKMSGPVPMTYYAKASSVKPPLIANENAFLGDVSCSTDGDKPISAGLYRLEKGTPLVYEYKYHEMKIVIEGSYDISDECGNTAHAVAGDVFYFPAGSKITFTTDDYGLAFYCGQRAKDTA
ncbi:putative ethanolamine utilization protein [Xylariaceae sp. FL0804]|nr:putative ethanolamine utilization protein [Xylariaceae sp. FL0804]